jgi:hypothetical protein
MEGAGYPQRRARYLPGVGLVTPNQPATSLLNFFSRVWTSLTPLFTVLSLVTSLRLAGIDTTFLVTGPRMNVRPIFNVIARVALAEKC